MQSRQSRAAPFELVQIGLYAMMVKWQNTALPITTFGEVRMFATQTGRDPGSIPGHRILNPYIFRPISVQLLIS